MKAFFTAISFLTIFRLNLKDYDNENAPAYFPLVGFLIGLTAYFVLSSDIYLKEIFALITIIVFTGALHLDGLADTADALFSHKDKIKKLEIMKDSRIGTMGAVTLIIVLIFKLNIFGNISPGTIPVAMFFSRAVGTYIISNSCYARAEGTGNFFKSYSFKENLLIFLLSSLVLFIFINLKQYILISVISFILARLLIRVFNFFFGGWTGDTIGASIEFSEIIILYLLSF